MCLWRLIRVFFSFLVEYFYINCQNKTVLIWANIIVLAINEKFLQFTQSVFRPISTYKIGLRTLSTNKISLYDSFNEHNQSLELSFDECNQALKLLQWTQSVFRTFFDEHNQPLKLFQQKQSVFRTFFDEHYQSRTLSTNTISMYTDNRRHVTIISIYKHCSLITLSCLCRIFFTFHCYIGTA